MLFDTDELLSKIATFTKKAYSSANPYLSFTFMKDTASTSTADSTPTTSTRKY